MKQMIHSKKEHSKPVLGLTRCGDTFYVEVDASDYAIGGELCQKDSSGNLHPVPYPGADPEKKLTVDNLKV